MNVLLSIKPRYVEEIIEGNKKYEFRRSIWRCREDVDMVYMYASSPMKKIVGAFTVEKIFEDHPEKLWNRFREFSGIKEKEFFNYFKTSKKGFAIEIEEVEVFETPINPKLIIPNFVPPQSFCYIDEHIEEIFRFRAERMDDGEGYWEDRIWKFFWL